MTNPNHSNDCEPVSVLLVEDSAHIRQRLCSLVADIPGLRLVGQATTVVEANQLFDLSEPSAVILDLGLPDGNGIDVLRRVRQANSKCVVIILSNYLDSETYNYCSDLGADFLFSKAGEFEQAIETLRALSNRTEKWVQERSDTERVARAKLVVTSPLGIHARPAALLVHLAQSFESEVQVSFDGHITSAKSILGLLSLGIGQGAELQVTALGDDADEAISSITDLFSRGFFETHDVVVLGGRRASKAAGVPHRTTGARILVASDDDGIRALVKMMLKESECQIVTARDGVEAMALLTADRGAIKAAVLDMNIQRIAGREAMSAMRRIRSALPLLVLTSPSDILPVNTDVATAFLRKPFSYAELVLAFWGLLNRTAPSLPNSGRGASAKNGQETRS